MAHIVVVPDIVIEIVPGVKIMAGIETRRIGMRSVVVTAAEQRKEQQSATDDGCE
jgi:hypothetical protein